MPARRLSARLISSPKGGSLLERDALLYPDVPEKLRQVSEPGLVGERPSRRGDERGEVEAGQRPVAGRRQVRPDQVAGRLAAEKGAAPLHLLDDVPVADGRAEQRDAERRQRPFEPVVRHDRPDDGGRLPPLADELVRPEVEDVVAVEEPPRAVGEDDPVGVAVEREAEVGACLATTARAIASGWSAPAPLVDVPTIGRGRDRVDTRAPAAPERERSDLERGAVRRVDRPPSARRAGGAACRRGDRRRGCGSDGSGEAARGAAARARLDPRSIPASTASGSFRPSREKSLMPLSRQGLWEAETETPASAPSAPTSQATAGVGTTPAKATRRPPARRARRSARRRSPSVDSRVSPPTTTRGGSAVPFLPERGAEGGADARDRLGVERRNARLAADSVGTEEATHGAQLT